MLSDLNPWMALVKAMAASVRANRRPCSRRQSVRCSSSATARSRSRRRSTSIATPRDELHRARVQGDLRVALAGGRGRRRGEDDGAPGRRIGDLGAGGAQAAQAARDRGIHRAGDAARCLGAADRLRAAPGRSRRRASVQPVPPDDRGDDAGEPAVAGGAEGGDQASGVRARARRGARAGRAAQARARHGRSAGAASTPRGR